MSWRVPIPPPLVRGWIILAGSRSFAALHSGLYSVAPPALGEANGTGSCSVFYSVAPPGLARRDSKQADHRFDTTSVRHFAFRHEPQKHFVP